LITLFPDQDTAIAGVRDAFRTSPSVLLVAPTGFGKTVAFSYICASAVSKGKRVWIMAHRVELVDQIADTLRDFNVSFGYIAAGYPKSPAMRVQVASVQTLVRRAGDYAAPDLIIVDEAHHATTKNTIGRILAKYLAAKVLGVTATPTRLSGEGMGDVFKAMVLGPSVQTLIDNGRLSPVTVYAPPTVDLSGLHVRAGDFVISEAAAAMDKPKITGDAVTHYRKHADRKRAVAFCTSVDHARHVALQFVDAGYRSVHVDGGMDRYQRRQVVDAFKKGEINVLTSCDLVSEGFDCPGIEVGISLRPTASTGLWIQQVGRCLRTADGKDRAIILDHAGNTLRHGLPTEDREWTLAGRERACRANNTTSVSVRVCPQCFASQQSGMVSCRECGYVYPISARKVEAVEGELQEVLATKAARKEQGRAKSIEALIELGRARGYKDPIAWANYVYRGRQQKRRAA